jgi:hypothetical protein
MAKLGSSKLGQASQSFWVVDVPKLQSEFDNLATNILSL